MIGSERDKVVREILSYFVRNPHAADDLEGIVRWRLLNETVHRKVDETQAALARLVECGYLIETKQIGIEPIFTLDPAKRGDAERLVSEPEPPQSNPSRPSSDGTPCP